MTIITITLFERKEKKIVIYSKEKEILPEETQVVRNFL